MPPPARLRHRVRPLPPGPEPRPGSQRPGKGEMIDGEDCFTSAGKTKQNNTTTTPA